MPYRNLSLEEFARHVNMDIREVRRLAERGRLPGEKIAGQWRFHVVRVNEWLEREMPGLDDTRLAGIERVMGEGDSDADPATLVTSLIGLDGIDVALPARTRSSVLQELVALGVRTGIVYDGDGLLEAVCEREELCTTALPDGVAIPHPREPLPYASAEPIICVGRVPGGIAFGGPGGELTHVFFLISCHDDRHHLRVLARLMRILDAATIRRLQEVETSEELLEVLITREEVIAAR